MELGDARAEGNLRGEERESQNLQIAGGRGVRGGAGLRALAKFGDAFAEQARRGEGAIPYGRTSLATLNSVLYSAAIASMMRVQNGAGRSWCRFLSGLDYSLDCRENEMIFLILIEIALLCVLVLLIRVAIRRGIARVFRGG
jgi:hypothetical protein